MQISSNHPFLSTTPDMMELSNPLKKLGITYFTYTKSDASGGRTYLTNNAACLENYMRKKFYLVGNCESAPKNYKSQVVHWSTLPKQYIYDNARSRGIDHGIFMIEPQDDYCEYFAFATYKGNERIINTYLTNMDYLKKFTQAFKEQAALIIDQAEKNKIILPFHNDKLDFVTDHVDTNDLQSKLVASHLPSDISLSQRQIQCCVHLMNGKTAKEIAQILGLSARTVEYYLDNIRTKLQCNNKAELITKLSQLLRFK